MISITRARIAFLAALVGLGSLCLAADSLRDKKPLPLMVPHTKFSQDCGQCHVSKEWDVMRDDFRFDHAKETGYPLNGAHAQAKCVRCHNDRGPASAYASRGCRGCHPDPHRASLGTDCAKCHTEVTWRPVGMLSEHSKTGFPLTGAHRMVDCQKCHVRASVGEFAGLSTFCSTCHSTDYQRAPNHVSMRYPTTCETCHTTTRFSGARFDHGFLSNLSDCYRCHQTNYQTAPHHTEFSFPTSCGDCHSTRSFTPARFNHNFLGATANCYSCHAADYQRAPNHVGVKATTCYDCHLTTTWDR